MSDQTDAEFARLDPLLANYPYVRLRRTQYRGFAKTHFDPATNDNGDQPFTLE
jgi:hypothetical protein